MTPMKKAFDCVEESRKWREAASAKLNAMSAEEELAYLSTLVERHRAAQAHRLSKTTVLREEPSEYGTKKP